MKDRWAVYFVWNDGTADTFNCETAKERDCNIKEMKNRGTFNRITYCRIYANGEYGEEIEAYQNGERVRERFGWF